MPGTIHDFSVSYDAANEANTFTCGDLVKGRVALQLGKEAKIEYLFVKVTGDADVRWTERHGDDNRTYSAHERYFKLKQMLISEEAGKGGQTLFCCRKPRSESRACISLDVGIAAGIPT